MANKRTGDSQVFQLKVTLAQSKPPIWRRVQVRGSETLEDLHYIIQSVMGWGGGHLHQFIANDRYYGMRDFMGDPLWDLDMIDERRVRLDQIVSKEKDRFRYEYDFGDGWMHAIVVEKVFEPEADVRYPVCTAGRRACPPDDIGGIWGFYDFLEAIQDPQHPDHADLLEWIGGSFDPDEFDLELVNQGLRRGE